MCKYQDKPIILCNYNTCTCEDKSHFMLTISSVGNVLAEYNNISCYECWSHLDTHCSDNYLSTSHQINCSFHETADEDIKPGGCSKTKAVGWISGFHFESGKIM